MAERLEHGFARREKGGRQLTRIRLEAIGVNPAQPRQVFSEAAIMELASSIRQHGLLSPLVVRRSGSGYQLIAGERRLRALRLLGEEETYAAVLTASDSESAVLALIENLQRENLSFFEEAEAYQALIREHGVRQEELAGRLSKSPSAVANRLRLLKLPPSVRAGVSAGGLSERHARALLRLSGEEKQLSAVNRAVKERLNVRQTEEMIDRMLREGRAANQPAAVLCRDPRLFVNAMLDTVRTLQNSGADIASRVENRADSIEITVTISRAAQSAVRT